MTEANGSYDYEAIVVGSGFGGAVTACRLVAAGVKTCILERGQRFDPESDFPVYPATNSPNVPSDAQQEGHDIVQPDVSQLLWGFGGGLWDLRDLGGVLVGQAAGFGGGSLIYANVHLRPPEHVFDERWPIKRKSLERYYDLVAQMLDVSPLPEAHRGLPKRVQLRRAAADLRTDLPTDESYLRSFEPPLAVNFDRKKNGRGVCDLAGNCTFGCKKSAKNTLDFNYLRRAEGKPGDVNRADVVTRAEVVWIEQRDDSSFEVEYLDHAAGKQSRTLTAKHVFVCAGAVNTTELLLRCRQAGKLKVQSEALGTYFYPNMDTVAPVFDCDEPQELDRGPTITSSLLYDRLHDKQEPSTRWRLRFCDATFEPAVGSALKCGSGGTARVAAPPYLVSGSYERGDAIGELMLDELQGAFEEGAELKSDAGACGKIDIAASEIRDWFLVQDGGLPAELEPTLGVFRSPLWLRRNAFREQSRLRSEHEWPPSCADHEAEHAAVSQRIGYAELPFEALTDLLSGLARNVAGPQLHEVSEVGLQLLRAPGSPHDERGTQSDAQNDARDPADRRWALIPDQLRRALEQLRRQMLDDVGIAAEDLVAAFLDSAAEKGGQQLRQLSTSLPAELRKKLKNAEDLAYPVRLGLRLGVQLLWGSQGGMATAIAQELGARAIPGRGQVVATGVEILKRLLDYRLGNGRTAILLSMGLDSAPGRLELELPSMPQVGTVVRGAKSGTLAVLLKERSGSVIVAGEDGDFALGELLLAGQQKLGIFEGHAQLHPKPRADDTDLPLSVLYFTPDDSRKARSLAATAPFRASLPAVIDTAERGVQQRVLRDIASAWRGELRTDPMWTFLNRRSTVHPQGGCPMGDAPRKGVTDIEGQVHGCPGLYVMDAAAFPGPVGANPSATIAAVAEYKVELFLRRRLEALEALEARLEEDTGHAKELEGKMRAIEAELQTLEQARAAAENWVKEKWVDQEGRNGLDPLGPKGEAAPIRHSAEPAHRPVGIEFEEKMVGALQGEGAPQVEAELTVRIDDLATFLARHRRDSNVEIPIAKGDLKIGARIIEIDERKIEIDGRDFKIDPTKSYMRIMADRGFDESGREVRAIEYVLVSDDGNCRLEGAKKIRDDEGLDAWEDTTTLTFCLSDIGLEGEGVLRLPAEEFFSHQIPSFKADTDDPSRQAWAMATFAKFFLGNLVDVYVPTLEPLFELGASIARRAHE